ncbi:OB-fold domain-containing protein [Nocardia sp. NBC_00565]|uniref:OB-fold domain-containing protein n=1 Tax=Nocardia sp. NBC_00565 TaxID=2975993 RepID=UPI002E809B68|nr:OB-fold domain-containing protein [Nocardia sp. NBC_00565]WUC05777.1 OB-fold domain-containing protein [Nocardia sp. NBC_00565]
MSFISSLGTYLPPCGSTRGRVAAADEDAVTLAVEAGRSARPEGAAVARVVLITRDIPLLEGGSAAVLLAGLGLDPDIEVIERLGGAPTSLDAIAGARAHTLVIAVDLAPAGAAAALVGETGLAIRPIARLARSLPARTRDGSGAVHDYGDPRLLRERGVLESLRTATTDKPRVVAGVDHKLAAALCDGTAPQLPTTGASAALFALAWMSETATRGPLLGVEQASVTGLAVDSGSAPVHRNEPALRPVPKAVRAAGPEIPISLAAYDRAFSAKLRWQASRDPSTGELDFPPRLRVDDNGRLIAGAELVPLPRTGTIYTVATVHVPVPGLDSPYSLVIVELDDVDVRALVKITGAEPGSVAIGDRGHLVLRRVAIRSGIPDYGYAFRPETAETTQEEVA